MLTVVWVSFAVFQLGFLGLDIFELWRLNARPSFKEITLRYRSTIVFLVLIWLAYFIIQATLLTLLPSLTKIEWVALLITPSELPVETWHIALSSAVVLLIVSFWDYWIHRLLLHHRYFWWLHEYHHLPKVIFSGMPGISVRPFVVATSFANYFLAAVTVLFLNQLRADFIRVSALSLSFLILFLTLLGSFSHSLWAYNRPWFYRIFRWSALTTPQEHFQHHAIGRNGNFGNFMMIWDHVFGTYIKPSQSLTEYGLEYDQDFLGTLTFSKVKIPEHIRSKVQIKRLIQIYNKKRTSSR